MPIRSYQTGDEHAQSEIYNAVAGSLPGFKPSTAAEIARRYQGDDPDPKSRYFAVENGEVVGYAVFGPNGRVVRAKTQNQKLMAQASEKNDIIFAIGPAGTGKTYTAVALAVRALKNKAVRKIILTRPAVEAAARAP